VFHGDARCAHLLTAASAGTHHDASQEILIIAGKTITGIEYPTVDLAGKVGIP